MPCAAKRKEALTSIGWRSILYPQKLVVCSTTGAFGTGSYSCVPFHSIVRTSSTETTTGSQDRWIVLVAINWRDWGGEFRARYLLSTAASRLALLPFCRQWTTLAKAAPADHESEFAVIFLPMAAHHATHVCECPRPYHSPAGQEQIPTCQLNPIGIGSSLPAILFDRSGLTVCSEALPGRQFHFLWKNQQFFFLYGIVRRGVSETDGDTDDRWNAAAPVAGQIYSVSFRIAALWADNFARAVGLLLSLFFLDATRRVPVLTALSLDPIIFL